MTTHDPQKLYQQYKERFRGMSDEQLIDAFNREVGNRGWTSARASYLAALHEEFESRKYDYSAIGDKKGLSFNARVKLVDRRTVVTDDPGQE